MSLVAQISEVDISKRLKALRLKRSGLAVGLQGAAGIGKTYRAQALLRQTLCPSFSLHSTAPLERWLQTLPKPKTLDVWAERILERVAAGEAVPNIAEALGALLAKLAPVVVHLEDLHEAGAERSDLIAQLASIAQRSKGVGLLITSRVELPSPVETVRLAPLTEADNKSVLETQAGAELPAEATLWIYTQAAGNPLFTLEYFRHLTRMGNLYNDGQRWRWREPERRQMPSTVEALIERSLHEAADTTELAQVLQAKALLGSEDVLWAEVAGLSAERLEVLRQSLERRGVLRSGGFAHPLYREVLLQNLSPDQRQTLARKALQALSSDPRKAAEFVEAARLESAQALGLLERAIEAARQQGNPLQAARLQAKAVRYAKGATQIHLALDAARALRRFDIPEAIRLAGLVMDAEPTHLEAIMLAAMLTASRGSLEQAQHLLDRAPLEERSGGRGVGRRVMLYGLSGDYGGALKLWNAHPQAWETTDPEVLFQVAFAQSSTGNQEQALQVLQKVQNLPGLNPEQHWKAVYIHAAIHYRLGNYTRQEELTRQALVLARTGGQPQVIANTLSLRHYALSLLGRWREALVAMDEARTLYAEVGDSHNHCFAQVWVAGLLIQFGEYERAEEMLLQCRNLLLQSGDSATLVDCEKALTELYLAWPAPHARVLSLRHAQSALRAAQALNSPQNLVSGLLCVSAAESAQGNGERGLALATEALGVSPTPLKPWVFEARYHQAKALAVMGHTQEALQTFYLTRELAEELGQPLETHLVDLEIAHLKGDTSSARQLMEWFEQQGLLNGVNLVHRHFPQLTEKQGTEKAKDALVGSSLAFPQPRTLGALGQYPIPSLQVLGPMQMASEGKTQTVRGQKRRELLALLLEARLSARREVNKLELLDALYPGTDELQASTALKDIVYQLRELLGQAVIQTTEGGYALGEVALDAELFLQTGDTRLWRGPYLEGLSPTGDDTVRDALHLRLQKCAESLLESDSAEATRSAQLLLETDPYAPEYLRLTLRALKASKNHKAITRTYDRARERFAEVGEQLPERWREFEEERAKSKEQS